METYVGLIEGEVVVMGTYQTCLECVGTWTEDGFMLYGDCGIIPA